MFMQILNSDRALVYCSTLALPCAMILEGAMRFFFGNISVFCLHNVIELTKDEGVRLIKIKSTLTTYPYKAITKGRSSTEILYIKHLCGVSFYVYIKLNLSIRI